MKLKKQFILLYLGVALATNLTCLFSQDPQTKPTRQSSIEAFSKGDYEKAYSEFRELLLIYNKDPLYKYYSGVCLVKLNRDPGEATMLLQQAIQVAGSIKSLPADGFFYLGRAQQLSGKYLEATSSFNAYTDKVGKKTAKEMGVPEFLEQCSQNKGQLKLAENKQPEPVKKETARTDTKPQDVKPAVQSPVQHLPADYEKILSDATRCQFKADSVTAIVKDEKKEYEKIAPSQKTVLKNKITANEKLAASFQANADQKYKEAQALQKPLQDTVPQLKRTSQNLTVSNKDTAKRADNKTVTSVSKPVDTVRSNTVTPASQLEVFSFFEVLTNPADANAKIALDLQVPPGLIYRIQIAVFRNQVSLPYFKGLSPIYGFKVEGTDKIIYYAGLFRKATDASKALAVVKSKGFRDAFVAALSEGKRVSSDRAASIEKEWGGKPFYSIETSGHDTKADTITPTLTFRVQVLRTLNPLTEDVVDAIRKSAGNRGLDIVQTDDKKISYLIGKFITFETASEYADLLKRNGYRDAQPVAWLGKKEIAIETARKLMDNLK